ncbi:MAG: DUF447 family protein [Sulfolobales archaeon]
MRSSVLDEDSFWGFCRVVESLICVDLGSSLYHCSPAGLFRSSHYKYVRIFSDSRLWDYLGLRREAYILFFRDPLILLRILISSKFFNERSFKDLVSSGSLVTLAHFTKIDENDLQRIYLVDPLKDLKICCNDPASIPRICRAENMLVELLIHYTRRNIYARDTGEEFLKRRFLLDQLSKDLMRLGYFNKHTIEDIDLILRSIL